MLETFSKYLAEHINGMNEVNIKNRLTDDELMKYTRCSEALKYIRKNSSTIMPLELLRSLADGTVEIKRYEDLMLIDAIGNVLNAISSASMDQRNKISKILEDIIQLDAKGDDVLL